MNLIDVARRVALSEVVYGPGRTMPAHAHRESTIGLVLRGLVEEDVHGATHRSGPLGVVVKPAGVVHEDRFDARGARLLSFTLPRRAGHRFDRYVWFDGGEVARRALDVLRVSREGGSRSVGAIEALLETIARAQPIDDPEPWLVVARDALAAGRTVAEAARGVGVHPGSLTRAHRRTFGYTPVTGRARRRVARAAELLASTATELAAVAAQSGFSDQAHLTRVFGRETGTTPAVYRALVRD